MMTEEIQLLLDLFEEMVPDKESSRLVWSFCDEKHKWAKAHGLHSTLRDRNIKAIMQEDRIRECQYYFEEVIAKTLFNLTETDAPFDPDSPYWIIKNALRLANALSVSSEKVVEIVT